MVDQTGWEHEHLRLYEIYLNLKKYNQPLSEREKKDIALILKMQGPQDRENIAKKIREYFLATIKQDIDASSE
jgi:hypothetical protein